MNLRQELIDFCEANNLLENIKNIEGIVDTYLKVYKSIDSLALGKPEPLAKNKHDGNFFYCGDELMYGKNLKCRHQCVKCKEIQLKKM